LKANCTTIGGPLAGVSVAIRVVGLTPLITPVIVFSSPAARTTATVKNRPTAAPAATLLFVLIIVPPTLTRPRHGARLKRFLFDPASNCKGIQDWSARDGRDLICAARFVGGGARSFRDGGNHMTRTRVARIVLAALVAAAAFPGAARAECYLENVASPQEIAGGWTIHEDLRIVKQVDGAPYEQGGSGNWFVDRETTTLPMCSVFDDLGGYSLRSYMLQPVVTKSQVKICQATADGGSVGSLTPQAARHTPSV